MHVSAVTGAAIGAGVVCAGAPALHVAPKAPALSPNAALQFGGCFLAGTTVTTAAGQKAIEDVREGELVLAGNVYTADWSWHPVTKTHQHEYVGDIVTVAAGAERIEATGNHPFWVVSGEGLDQRAIAEDALGTGCKADPAANPTANGRWVQARDLRTGDRLLTHGSGIIAVTALHSRTERIKVYNLTVANLHTYAVGGCGVLVHNNSRFIAGRAFEVGRADALQRISRIGDTLDIHHVGQKAAMPRFVAGYDPATAPAILVPRVGHTIRSPAGGVVTRNAGGIMSARQLLARDIKELRRVYPNVPNAQLRRLIEMNKNMYPEMRPVRRH